MRLCEELKPQTLIHAFNPFQEPNRNSGPRLRRRMLPLVPATPLSQWPGSPISLRETRSRALHCFRRCAARMCRAVSLERPDSSRHRSRSIGHGSALSRSFRVGRYAVFPAWARTLPPGFAADRTRVLIDRHASLRAGSASSVLVDSPSLSRSPPPRGVRGCLQVLPAARDALVAAPVPASRARRRRAAARRRGGPVRDA
jgi:hypothetical protein